MYRSNIVTRQQRTRCSLVWTKKKTCTVAETIAAVLPHNEPFFCRFFSQTQRHSLPQCGLYFLTDYFDWEKKRGRNAAPPVIKIYNVYVSNWVEYLNMSRSEEEALQLISAYEELFPPPSGSYNWLTEYAGTAAQYSWFTSAAVAVCAKHSSIKLANIMSEAVPQYVR